ncbi:MAG: arsenate reductase ArsC [Dehalococcoidia bacterium]|nr:arsenate reductase ArsC [Dehalococcoidia bacterium]
MAEIENKKMIHKKARAVLFVCVHNSGRSQMAEAFFNQAVQGQAKALSAGTDPAPGVGPTVVEVMREIGIDLSESIPKTLTPEMLDGADKVITMGCGVEGVCPATFAETQDWELEDPKGQPTEKVRQIREQIRRHVMHLLDH